MGPKELQAKYIATVKDPRTYQDDVATAVEFIVSACAHALNVARVGLWLSADGSSDMTCLRLYDTSADAFESGAVLPKDDFPVYFEALDESRVVEASDAFTDPRTSELVDGYLTMFDVRSLLDATIRDVRDGALQGVLCAESVGSQRNWELHEMMFVSSMADLLSQRLITSEWKRSERNYEAIYDGSSEGIMVFQGATFQEVNPACCAMFGAEPEDLIGRSPVDFSPEFQPDGSRSDIASLAHIESYHAGNRESFEWRHCRKDGTEFDAEISLNSVRISGEDTMYALVRDVTEELEAKRQAIVAQQKLEHRASHDSLTGLMNRDRLHQHVAFLIDSLEDSESSVALLLLDLNRFKEINDTLGHATGDRVLIAIAELLEPRVNELGGCLFRLGGDEFVAVFESGRTTEAFDDLFRLLSECLASSIEVDGVSFEMGSSIGAAKYPDHGMDSHELLRCADVAMYNGKAQDGASPWYSKDTDPTDRRRMSIMSELKQGIRDDQLVLYYQPRINLAKGAVTGGEALVRWEHPERGLLFPNDFLVAAEMTEVIHPLTEWVMMAAFDQIARFQSLGYDVPIAVNLSARNLPDRQLFDLIEDQISLRNLPPELLEVEITESALINNPTRSIQNLKRLEALGVSIAIDDFGTGYSSLSLLKELPLDTLKIDRSFVKDMLQSATDQVIVNSTISLAHNFSARVVAEGVEDAKTLDALRAQSCDEAQGYFIARPMPVAQFEAWIADQGQAQAA